MITGGITPFQCSVQILVDQMILIKNDDSNNKTHTNSVADGKKNHSLSHKKKSNSLLLIGKIK